MPLWVHFKSTLLPWQPWVFMTVTPVYPLFPPAPHPSHSCLALQSSTPTLCHRSSLFCHLLGRPLVLGLVGILPPWFHDTLPTLSPLTELTTWSEVATSWDGTHLEVGKPWQIQFSLAISRAH